MIKRARQALRNDLREQYYLKMLADNYDYLAPDEPEDALRMYVIVRDDVLPPLNQGIQAAHAIVELCEAPPSLNVGQASKLTRWSAHDKTIVLLGADDIKMRNYLWDADERVIPYRTFAEPALGDLMTAVAFLPMTRTEANFLRGLRLAR